MHEYQIQSIDSGSEMYCYLQISDLTNHAMLKKNENLMKQFDKAMMILPIDYYPLWHEMLIV